MYPYDTCNTSILTVNGNLICRVQHESEQFRKSIISDALNRITPTLVDDVPEKFWGIIKNLVERGMKIDAIKLLRVVTEDTNSLSAAKEAVEFIATVEIRH